MIIIGEQEPVEKPEYIWEVYHRNDPDFRTYEEFTPRNYTFVADVRAADLYTVYEATNNIDKPWTENARIERLSFYASRGARSTSVGDIIVNKTNHEIYAVMPTGYEFLGVIEIEGPTITGT